MSIPSNRPHKDLPIFEYKCHDKKRGNDVYKLNGLKISEYECHMFFPIQPREELLIATALEHITFNPANKTMNDKFNIAAVKCGDIELFWCSFPKEFKDVCGRAAKVFGMTMKIMPRVVVSGTFSGIPKTRNSAIGTAIEFPRQENILCFEGKRCNDPMKIAKECEDIICVSNILEKLSVD